MMNQPSVTPDTLRVARYTNISASTTSRTPQGLESSRFALSEPPNSSRSPNTDTLLVALERLNLTEPLGEREAQDVAVNPLASQLSSPSEICEKALETKSAHPVNLLGRPIVKQEPKLTTAQRSIERWSDEVQSGASDLVMNAKELHKRLESLGKWRQEALLVLKHIDREESKLLNLFGKMT